MSATTLSSKYQIVIPKEVRDALALREGDRFEVIPFGGRVELVPILPLRTLFGLSRPARAEAADVPGSPHSPAGHPDEDWL